MITDYLKQEASSLEIFNKYNILIIYDRTTMVKQDADNIYNLISSLYLFSKNIYFLLA